MSAITIARRKWTSLSVATLAVAAVLPLVLAAANQVRGDPTGGGRSATSTAPVHPEPSRGETTPARLHWPRR